MVIAAARFVGAAVSVSTAEVVGAAVFDGAIQSGPLQVSVGMVVQAQAPGPLIVTYSPMVLPLAHMQ